mmetsp:Transcript_149122/g.285781  ORF Transcript_149122/g.285781 Transcript_149122/m.285781 type:complete len:479 (+) Transcript_149122:59-1495(+)
MSSYINAACAWAVFLFALLCQCQPCQEEVCRDVPSDLGKAHQAHAMLQKTVVKKKISATIEDLPDEVLCHADPESAACTINMPDGSSKIGWCNMVAGGTYGACRSSPTNTCSEVAALANAPCTWDGFPGRCVKPPYLGPGSGGLCNVWLTAVEDDTDGDDDVDDASASTATTCPASCRGPECGHGGRETGGLPLQNGKCLYTCSKKYSGYRYCGQGPNYTPGDSVDCSGCAAGAYIHAADGSHTCPTDYKSLGDLAACKAGLSIAGIEYSWGGADSTCKWRWPQAGCFTYGKKLYFSTCGVARPLSWYAHSGVCKKQSAVQTTTTTTATAHSTGCPASCEFPTCLEGGSHNGGLPLTSNKCLYHCSREFSGKRYCGTGSEYTSDGSVECIGCAEGKYIHAADGSFSCPAGYAPVIDPDDCKKVASEMTQYSWTGRADCSHNWPQTGCFSWQNQLYFSQCHKNRPLSQHAHDGICKKIE